MINLSLFFALVILFFAIPILLFFGLNRKYRQLLQHKEEDIKEQIVSELKKNHQITAAQLVMTGEENERTRISRELHDGLGGLLTAMKISISTVRDDCPNCETKTSLQPFINQLNESITELRRISHNLIPPTIVQFGLKEALSDFCDQMTSRRTKVTFHFYGRPSRFNNLIEIASYRIAQEAINNSLKHSEATEIMVQLILENEWMNLTIQDNGKGFVISKNGFTQYTGLRNMKARAESLEGRLDISSIPGTGTELTVDFILAPAVMLQ